MAVKQVKQQTTKTSTVIWIVVSLVVVVGAVLGITVTKRFRRAVAETNQVRNAVEEAARRQEMLVKAPARKEFSPAFLQMAFGDNPQLLEQIKEALNKAIGEKPQLSQGDVAMMLVTYRAEGDLRDVAIHVFGNLVPEHLPAFSSQGYWKGQLPENFYQIGQTMLSVLGREVMILANKEVEKRQRELLDAGLNDRFTMVQDYFHDPVSFIAVIPEPGKLFSDRFSPYMAAVLVKGKFSMDESRTELVALSYDQHKAQELAQVLSDTRLMAISITRLRYSGYGVAEQGFQSLQRTQIRVEGPTVILSSMVPGDVLQQALPRFIHTLSRGVGRIRRGPGYPG